MRAHMGFSLIELMITVSLIGILTAIAYPSYSSYVQDSRRQVAKQVLLESAQKLERYYAQNFNYDGAVSNGSVTVVTPDASFEDFYTLTATASANSFTLSATPFGSQATDECGTLTLNQANQTTPTDSGCW